MFNLPQLRNVPADGCGPCQACCDILGVEPLNKPYYARCSHLRGGGNAADRAGGVPAPIGGASFGGAGFGDATNVSVDVAGATPANVNATDSGQQQQGGCGIYESRPGQCARYRCAWHLGVLGPRTDRRPNECGVLFQFEPASPSGGWRLAAYETRPGSLLADRTMYLIRQILVSKKLGQLSLAPDVHLVPYGADLPIAFGVSNQYDYTPPPPGIPNRPHGQMKLWSGRVRELLHPRGVR